jgi:AcrR family transcriptional regulator
MAHPLGPSDVDRAPSCRRVLGSKQGRARVARPKIIEAALRLLLERGVLRFSAADAGVAAGYSRGIAAHYFKLSDELLNAALDLLISRWAPAVNDNSGGLSDMLRYIQRLIELAFAHKQETAALLRIYSDAASHEGAALFIERLHDLYVTKIERFLKNAKDTGDLRAGLHPFSQAVEICGNAVAVAFEAVRRDDKFAGRQFVVGLLRNLSPKTDNDLAREAVMRTITAAEAESR